MRRLVSCTAATAAALVVGAGGSAVPVAGAYVLGGRPWPGPTITYHTLPGAYAAAVDRAAAAWNRAHVGVRFTRASAADAEVVLRYGGPRCGGDSPVGFAGDTLTRSVVQLGKGCRTGLITLVAAHELGHVLGLDHENRRCARMNPVYDDTGTPDRCRRRSLAYWLAHPLLPDDIAGAKALARESQSQTQNPSQIDTPSLPVPDPPWPTDGWGDSG